MLNAILAQTTRVVQNHPMSDTMIKKTRVQRTPSSMKEALKQGSDDPKRGGKVGSDVRGAERTKIVEANHEHKTNIISETKEARTNESVIGFTAFFKNLKERGYGLIPYIFKEDHEITASEAELEVIQTTGVLKLEISLKIRQKILR